MPNISIANYPSDAPKTQLLARAIRDACLQAHTTIPELGKWEGKDVAIAMLGPTLFPDDGSPIQVVVEVLYAKPERTGEVLEKFGQLLLKAAKDVYFHTPRKVEVTFRPLFDPKANVIVEG